MSLSTAKRFGKLDAYVVGDYVVRYGNKGACHVVEKVESGFNSMYGPYTRYVLSNGSGGHDYAVASELRLASSADIRRHHADIEKSKQRRDEQRLKAASDKERLRHETQVVLEALAQHGVPPSSPLWDVWRANPHGAAEVMNYHIYRHGGLGLP